MRVVVVNHISLDGVLQGPGRADEDTGDGFRHGGWASESANDPAIGAAMGERMGEGFSRLFGRRSYEDMLEAIVRHLGTSKPPIAFPLVGGIVVSLNTERARRDSNS